MRPDKQGSLDRILALDLGDKRIGVALSDPTGTVARPLTVIRRSSRQADFEKIIDIVNTHEVNLLIIGLPVLLSGDEGSRATWTRDYSRELKELLAIEVILWDESFTTADAQALIREQGKDPRRYRNRIDAVAAAFILQSYLASRAISD